MTEIEHAGMGAAWLRSHPGTPIAHLDDEPCDTCDRPAPRDGTSRAASLAVAQAAEITRLREIEAALRQALEWSLDYIEGLQNRTRPPLAEPFLSERLTDYRRRLDPRWTGWWEDQNYAPALAGGSE